MHCNPDLIMIRYLGSSRVNANATASAYDLVLMKHQHTAGEPPKPHVQQGAGMFPGTPAE